MKNTRTCFPIFSFYDRTGIQSYLEQQAQQGWLLSKIGPFGWRFRRIEPKKLHFAVTYFPAASAFAPGPSEAQQRLFDFCAHTGWQPAAESAQMQIFYNEADAPIPIETDAALELENIHRSAKKAYLPTYCIQLLLGLMQLGLLAWRLREDVIGVLASGANLFSAFCWLLVLLLCLVEVVGYFRWYRRARAAAEADGSFVETRSHRSFQLTVLLCMLLALVFTYAALNDGRMGVIGLITILAILAITAVVVGSSELMKHLKAKTAVNRAVTIALTLLLSFSFPAVFLMVIFSSPLSGTWLEREPYATYEFRGHIYEIYHDPLPLTIEDMTGVDYDGYSYELWQSAESFLLAKYQASQRPRYDGLEYPDLSYTVVEVKLGLLYEACKSAMLSDFAHNYGVPDPTDDLWKEYAEVEAAPWGANAAYRLYLGGEAQERYLLCYDERIVEMDFDWVIGPAEMAAVGETFG